MYQIEYLIENNIIKTIPLGNFNIITESEIIEELYRHHKKHPNYNMRLTYNNKIIEEIKK